MVNGLLAFGAGLTIMATAVSAVLATYFLRKNSYKDAEAASIFAGIFAFVALILFVWIQVSENAEISNLRKAITTGASLGKQGVVGGLQSYGYLQPKATAPVAVAQPAANPLLQPEPAGFAQ